MKPLVIGIVSQEQVRERLLSIATGLYTPEPSEPHIWFYSMRSVAELLSDKNG